MKNAKKIGILLLTTLTLGGAVVCSGNLTKKLSFTIAGTEATIWKHYAEVAPTATTPGIKEYWVSCSDSSHVFAAPTGNVEIQEGVWDNEKKAAVIALEDDRYIPANPVYISSTFASNNSIYVIFDETQYAYVKENYKSVSLDIDFNDSTLNNVSGGASMLLSDMAYVSIRKDSDGLFLNFNITNGVANVVIDSTMFDSADLTMIRFRLKGKGNENVAFTNAKVSNIVFIDKPISPAYDIPQYISGNKLCNLYDETKYSWIKANTASVEFDVDFTAGSLTSADNGTTDLADLTYFSLRTGSAGSAGSLAKNFSVVNGVAHVVFDSTVFANESVVMGKFLLKNKDNGNVAFVDAEISNIVVEDKPANPAYNIPSELSGSTLCNVYDVDSYTWIKENTTSVEFDVDFNDATLVKADNGGYTLADLTYFSLRTGSAGSAGSLAKNFSVVNGVAHVVFDSTVFANESIVMGKFLLKNGSNGNITFNNATVKNLVVNLKAE